MILRHKDRALLRFDWIQPFGVKNVELDRGSIQFLPLDFRETASRGDSKALERALEDWLLRRTPPMERRFMREMLTGLGFDPRDPRYLRRLIEFSLGLSLNDVHWIVPDGFPWSQGVSRSSSRRA